MHDKHEKKILLFTPLEWRMIGISLAILSLGTAIAWFGFLLFNK